MGRLEGYGKGSLAPWPLGEMVTAELLLCQEQCIQRSAANTLKGRSSVVLRGGINVQACVQRKQHCSVESVFTDTENILIDHFKVVHFFIFLHMEGREKVFSCLVSRYQLHQNCTMTDAVSF